MPSSASLRAISPELVSTSAPSTSSLPIAHDRRASRILDHPARSRSR
jgi:hypothetical protein